MALAEIRYSTFNLFDNLLFGVLGVHSNLYATNNVFQLLPRVPTLNFGGRGIHLVNQNLGTDEYSLEVEGNNRFCNCAVGIEVAIL